jgi:hypothetical protein
MENDNRLAATSQQKYALDTLDYITSIPLRQRRCAIAYRLYAFDGIQLSEYLQSGDEQNMGTGAALSAYLQIPGGWFNHYSGRRAPQGIRPITKRCLLVGVDNDDILDKLVEVRAKIGIEGKLTIQHDNGDLWWQWATLKNLDTAQTFDFQGAPVLPCDFTFESASQLWYKTVVSPTEWTWGDLSWTFGDGTAAIGESGTSAALTAGTGATQIFTTSNGGGITAVNVAVTVTAGTDAITAYTYTNHTTGDTHRMGSLTLAAGESLTVNGGDRSVWQFGVPMNIASLTNTFAVTASISTSPTTHGLTTGNYVRIRGTGNYDGIHKVTVTSTTTFTIPSKIARASGLALSVGTVEKATSQYAFFAANRCTWPTLATGDNLIYLANVAGNASGDATIAWEFYEHYA